MSDTRSKRIPATQINNLVTADLKGLFDHGTLLTEPQTGDILGILLTKNEDLVHSLHALHELARIFKSLWDEEMRHELTPQQAEKIDKLLSTIN